MPDAQSRPRIANPYAAIRHRFRAADRNVFGSQKLRRLIFEHVAFHAQEQTVLRPAPDSSRSILGQRANDAGGWLSKGLKFSLVKSLQAVRRVKGDPQI